MQFGELTLSLAFLAGLASFLSPCVFALVPAYIGYLGGRSVAISGDAEQSNSWGTFSHGLAFVLGFSIVFVSLGLLASTLGSILYDFSGVLVRVGGIVVILFGLHMMGVIHIRFLDYDLRAQADPQRNRSYASSALMGVFFSAGWSPCVGPILGAILTLALNEGPVIEGGLLLGAYSAGLAIPFLLAATQIGWVTYILRRYGRFTVYVERAMGVVLVVLGAFLFSGRFATLANLGFFFDLFDEVVVGRLLLVAVGLSLTIGLVPALWARRRGRNFVDWWFLGVGATLMVLVLLYFLGLIPAGLLAV